MSQIPPAPSQAKISRRLALRTLFLILLMGACFRLFEYWKDKSGDLANLKPADTVGWLAAVQYLPNGQQLVAFSPDGKLTPSPGWKEGNTDRDLTWNPSGNRLFFVTDRKENNFNLFRWNPTDGSDPDQRSYGSRSHAYPQFARQAGDNADASALIISGGFTLEYTPKDMSTTQILPPLGREIVNSNEEEGGGASDQFSGPYGALGKSFKIARWCKGKTWVAAVMNRKDAEGEVLILQSLQPSAEGEPAHPQPIAAGDHIDFDVSPLDGTVVFSVENFQWPADELVPDRFKKGNRITRPFVHFLGKIDPGEKGGLVPIAVSKDDNLSFGSPVISPDGASVVFIEGKYENGALTPKSLSTLPCAPQGYISRAVLVFGSVHEPTWSPDGKLLAFAQEQPSGKRALMEINADGTGLKNLSGDTGNFGYPVFSPQMKQ